MRILHLNSGLKIGGGLEKIIIELITKNNDYSNYLCVINNQWSEDYIKLIDRDKILLCNRKIGSKNVFSNFKVIYKLYKFVIDKKIDLIHCHNPFSLKIAYIIKKLLKIKVVFTVHDTDAYFEELNKYPVDKYIAISQSVYQTINKYVSNNHIELIYNGVDLERFNKCRKMSKVCKPISIACVARIMPKKKGQDILIKALDILKRKYRVEFNCFFAGSVSNSKDMDILNSLVKKYNLEKEITFLGNVNNVEDVYEITDIMVLPSRYEGFGLVVVEALAAGCSVIVSKVDGPLEIVKENEEYGMFFENENYEELAYKIHRLIELLKNNNNYNDQTMQYIERNFSVKNMISSYNYIYGEFSGN